MPDPERADAGQEAAGESKEATGSPELRAFNDAVKERGERLKRQNGEIAGAFTAAQNGAKEVRVDDYDLPQEVPEDGEFYKFGGGETEPGLVAITVGEDGTRVEEIITRRGENSWEYLREQTTPAVPGSHEGEILTPVSGSDHQLADQRPEGAPKPGQHAIALHVDIDARSVGIHADSRMTKMGWSKGGEQRPNHQYEADDDEDTQVRDWVARRMKGEAETDFRIAA